ncbi:MAG: hypothetical protein EPN93_12595 [Spirochaetes bacterium]|nr:MAG: hypothetical protein EPN93_12595 [Spirochaetota bacterium]
MKIRLTKTAALIFLLTILSLMACATAPKTHNDYVDLFRDEFPNPVVRVSASPLPQFSVCSVYDKSWEAEDPLIPQTWIATADGKIFRGFEIEKALLHAGYEAKSAQDAMMLLELYMMVSDGLTLIRDPDDEYFKPIIPAAERVKIRKPSCERLANAWVVRCHALSSNARQVLFRNKPVIYTLEAVTLRADGRSFAHERRPVWSSASGTEPE